MISDLNLIELLSNRPEEGLELMMDTYMNLVYTIVCNQLENICSNEDIEECVSDVFFDVFKYRDKINLEKGSIKGFLSIVAKRKAIDLYRKNKTQHNIKVPIEDADIIDLDNIDDLASSVAKKERNNTLINIIKSLGEPDSEIIIRKYYLRQSSKDISKILGLKANTVDKRSSRCIQKLKHVLGGVL